MCDQKVQFKLTIQNTFQLINTYMIGLHPPLLSPKPIAYDKPIDPSEMPWISTCPDTMTDDTKVLTKDDKYTWLDPDDK